MPSPISVRYSRRIPTTTKPGKDCSESVACSTSGCRSELAQRKLNDAAGTLVQLKLIRPDDPALAQIDAKLAEAQIRRQRISRRQGTHVRSVAQLVHANPRSKLVEQRGLRGYSQLRRMPSDPRDWPMRRRPS